MHLIIIRLPHLKLQQNLVALIGIVLIQLTKLLTRNRANIYFFKVSMKTRKQCEINSNLTIKPLSFWYIYFYFEQISGVSIVNLEQFKLGKDIE